MKLRHWHLGVGLLALLTFFGTGQYMHWRYDHLRPFDETVQLLFRSTHIYLLLLALVNIALGLYLHIEPEAWRRRLQILGSAVLLVTPWMMLLAFLTEPFLMDLARPYSKPALYASLGAVVTHLASQVRRPGKRSVPREDLR